MVSSVSHVYSPEDIIPTHHCEKFLPGSYFALILDANPSQPNQTKIEAKPVRLIPNTTKLHSSFCLIIKKKIKKSQNVKNYSQKYVLRKPVEDRHHFWLLQHL